MTEKGYIYFYPLRWPIYVFNSVVNIKLPAIILIMSLYSQVVIKVMKRKKMSGTVSIEFFHRQILRAKRNVKELRRNNRDNLHVDQESGKVNLDSIFVDSRLRTSMGSSF